MSLTPECHQFLTEEMTHNIFGQKLSCITLLAPLRQTEERVSVYLGAKRSQVFVSRARLHLHHRGARVHHHRRRSGTLIQDPL